MAERKAVVSANVIFSNSQEGEHGPTVARPMHVRQEPPMPIAVRWTLPCLTGIGDTRLKPTKWEKTHTCESWGAFRRGPKPPIQPHPYILTYPQSYADGEQLMGGGTPGTP